MKLYFRDKKGDFTPIQEVDKNFLLSDCIPAIKDFLGEEKFNRISFFRHWLSENNELIIDFGSWTEVFIIKDSAFPT